MNIESGILFRGQYLYLFVLSCNPALFRLFKPKHLLFLIFGGIISIFNHRAILPILLVILLDLDYSKCDRELRQRMYFYSILAFAIVSIFGGGI